MRVMDLPVAHEDGSFVSEKVSRIVELIREYDPRLDVRWIPRAARDPGDAAFAIVELGRDNQWRTAFLVEKEEDFDERVLARIYGADSTKHDIQGKLEAMQKAQQALKDKEWSEAIAEANDKARFLWKTPYHTVNAFGQRFHL